MSKYKSAQTSRISLSFAILNYVARSKDFPFPAFFLELIWQACEIFPLRQIVKAQLHP